MSEVSLRDIERAINRLEDKIDVEIKDHENRLRSIEQYQNKLLGASAVISLIAGYFGSYVKGIIK